jgi:hypothetical protein
MDEAMEDKGEDSSHLELADLGCHDMAEDHHDPSSKC